MIVSPFPPLATRRTELLATTERTLQEAVEGNLSGNILPFRTAGKRWATTKAALVNGGRGHVRLRAAIMLRQPGPLKDSAQLENLRQKLTTYMNTVSKLQVSGQGSILWTADDIKEGINTMFSLGSEMESALSALKAAFSECDDARAQMAKAQASGKRLTQTKAAQAMRPYLDKGMAFVWASKLKDIGLVPEGPDGIMPYTPSEPSVPGAFTEWQRPAWFCLENAAAGRHAV